MTTSNAMSNDRGRRAPACAFDANAEMTDLKSGSNTRSLPTAAASLGGGSVFVVGLSLRLVGLLIPVEGGGPS